MKLRVLTVGRGGCAWADDAVAEYGKRLKRHGGIDEVHVRAEPFRGDVDAVRLAETERLLRKVGRRDRLIALDERGEDLTTEGLVEWIDHGRTHGVHRLVFALGGPYGHDPSLRDEAWRVLRLSSLVLNHEVARVVLYEQLYRVMTVIEGSPYHH